jgi:uncharacterized protein (TIGR00297 family)
MRPRIPFWIVAALATALAVAHLPPPADPVDRLLSPGVLTAVAVNILFALTAWFIGGVSASGAVAGSIIGSLILGVAGWPAWSMLAATFVIAAGTTRVGALAKERAGLAEGRRGRRAAGNVVANTGAAALWVVVGVALRDPVTGAMGLAAALATAASDTAASEIGKAWQARTWRLVPLRPVPPGTNGAVSIPGTVAGVGAAALLAGVAAWTDLVAGFDHALVVAGAASGALILESLIALVAEDTGWLDNDGVNFLNTVVVSLCAVLAI